MAPVQHNDDDDFVELVGYAEHMDQMRPISGLQYAHLLPPDIISIPSPHRTAQYNFRPSNMQTHQTKPP